MCIFVTMAFVLTTLAAAASAQSPTISSVAAPAFGTVFIPIRLDGMLDAVALQLDVYMPAGTRIPAHPGGFEGVPDCIVNPEIAREATLFAYRPQGCDPAVDCTSVRAIVLSFRSGATKPTPARWVVGCAFEVAPDATGSVGAVVWTGQASDGGL